MTQAPTKQIPSWLTERLPVFRSAHYLPQRFADSTHDLWRLKMENNTFGSHDAFLKVCNNTDSPFWQIMQQLFGLNLREEIAKFDHLYQIVGNLSRLPIPELIKAESFNDSKAGENGAFILSSTVSGSVVDNVNLDMVRQLAEYIADLHQHKKLKWGLLGKANLAAQQWNKRLRQVLTDFSVSKAIPKQYFSNATEAVENLSCNAFIPLMPDLRWDQFMQEDQKLTSMVDLDAFVLAPRELDFVLLEYILTAEQHEQFVGVYSELHPIPDISGIRPAYRLLLFFMQVLGEVDIDLWMNVEKRF